MYVCMLSMYVCISKPLSLWGVFQNPSPCEGFFNEDLSMYVFMYVEHVNLKNRWPSLGCVELELQKTWQAEGFWLFLQTYPLSLAKKQWFEASMYVW